jgi:hypothetical protein
MPLTLTAAPRTARSLGQSLSLGFCLGFCLALASCNGGTIGDPTKNARPDSPTAPATDSLSAKDQSVAAKPSAASPANETAPTANEALLTAKEAAPLIPSEPKTAWENYLWTGSGARVALPAGSKLQANGATLKARTPSGQSLLCLMGEYSLAPEHLLSKQYPNTSPSARSKIAFLEIAGRQWRIQDFVLDAGGSPRLCEVACWDPPDGDYCFALFLEGSGGLQGDQPRLGLYYILSRFSEK